MHNTGCRMLTCMHMDMAMPMPALHHAHLLPAGCIQDRIRRN